jgi:digeranylgeranylglycerophospholipid reductase
LAERSFDVIVVGAGPAGCRVACGLASRGHDVVVLEQKSEPGLGACCTGIISAECFKSLDPSDDVVLAEVRSARFVSPTGRVLRLESEKIQAYVVNRSLLDRALAARAESSGAQFLLPTRVVDILPEGASVRVEALRSGAKEVFRARAVVLASGFAPGLPRRLGLGRPGSFLIGAQAEAEVRDIPEVEVHFGPGLGNGSFAWLVPAGGSKAYAGLLSTARAGLQLRGFLSELFRGAG